MALLIVLEGLWQCAEHTGRSGVQMAGVRVGFGAAAALIIAFGKYMKFSVLFFFHPKGQGIRIFTAWSQQEYWKGWMKMSGGAEHPVSRCLLNAAGDIAPYKFHPLTTSIILKENWEVFPFALSWCFLPVYFLNPPLLSSYEESGSERCWECDEEVLHPRREGSMPPNNTEKLRWERRRCWE